MKKILNLIKDEEAAGISEYALALGVILFSTSLIISSFGTKLISSVSRASNVLPI